MHALRSLAPLLLFLATGAFTLAAATLVREPVGREPASEEDRRIGFISLAVAMIALLAAFGIAGAAAVQDDGEPSGPVATLVGWLFGGEH